MNHEAALRASRDFAAEAEAMLFMFRDSVAGLRAYSTQYASVDRATYLEYRSLDHPIAPSSVGELLDRCAPGGTHERRLADATVVTLYALWESVHRNALADALGIPVDDVKIPDLGDVRLLRHAIVHRTGDALAGLARCQVLRWFPPGHAPQILASHIEEMIGRVRSGVHDFVLKQIANEQPQRSVTE